MPYISQCDRERACSEKGQNNAGELNYMLTLICKDYIEVKGLSYQTINDIVGALEGAKLEFYRRIAVGYEEQKRHDNGDVYHD